MNGSRSRFISVSCWVNSNLELALPEVFHRQVYRYSTYHSLPVKEVRSQIKKREASCFYCTYVCGWEQS